MNTKEQIDKKYFILVIVYLVGVFGMLSLSAAIGFTKTKPPIVEKKDTYQNISQSWTWDPEGTEVVDVKKLGKHMDPESGLVSIYYVVPEISADTSLVYRSKDVYTRILVDGNVIYETMVYDSPYYNKSPGNLWNMLTIDSKYSGKVLEMQISMVYDTSAVTVDSLYLGDKTNIILGLCDENAFGIVISIFLMLLGLVLLVVDFLPAYGQLKKRHGLCWLAIYALMNGLWGILETNIMQFFVDDMRQIQIMDNMLVMFNTVPLVMYIHYVLGILNNKVIRIFCWLCALYGVVCVGIQYTPGWDIHSMLAPSSLFSVTTDILMCVWLILYCMKLRKEKKPLVNCLLITIGISFMCVCTILETVTAIRMDRLDRAGYIRLGMLVLCIIFAIAGQIETYKIVGQGLRYELVSKLAYFDGLTELGNRTAYLEDLDSYKTDFKSLGIVYLDVNDLKEVNDNQGHEYGDKLIQKAARIIENSFGVYGKSYRIGGDEFCVLMTGNNIVDNYNKAVEVFIKLMDEENSSEKRGVTVQIAHGFAMCQEGDEIEEAIAKADNAMYQNKAMLKSKM